MDGRIKRWKRRAARRYTAAELAGLFFAFSAFGWVWEVLLRLWCDGRLVNPGTLHGLWLPSYGVGGVLAILLLRRYADRPFRVLVLGTGLCGAIELAAGWLLELSYGLRWWDYSAWPLNIDGLVCAPVSLVFGLACCAAVYGAGPALADRFGRLSRRQARHCCAMLAMLFALDLGWSAVRPNAGAGVNDYGGGQSGMPVLEVAQAAALLQTLTK